MKKQWKIVIGVLGLVLVLGGATLAYHALSDFVMEEDMVEVAGESVEDATEEELAPEDAGELEVDSGTVNGLVDAERAPDFTVLNSDGAEVSLWEYLEQGKPVVINFWTSWCPACRDEMPDFDRVYQEFGEEVLFMMVNLVDGLRETMESGAEFVEEGGYTFPVYFDVTGEGPTVYEVQFLPTTVFIDRNGVVTNVKVGRMSEADLRSEIEGL